LGLLALAWASWASYHSLALSDSAVPIDRVGLAYAWTGLAFVVVGLATWLRGVAGRTGTLMALCGFLLLLPSLTVVHSPVLWTLGATLNSAYQPVLFYLVLGFPEGRLRGRSAYLVMTAVVVAAICWGPLIAPLSLPDEFGCTGCPPSTNLLYVAGHDELALQLIDALARWEFVVWASLLAFVSWRFARSTAPGRRVLAPVYLTTVVWASARLVQASTLFLDWIPFDTVQFVGLVALALLPLGFALGLLRARARRWRVGSLALELQQRGERLGLQAAVARALGDPTVDVGIWSAENGRYLRADGERIEVPDGPDRRAATFLEDEGQPVAVLVHDAALAYDPQFVQGVGAVTRLAIENERLAAAVQTQLEEVQASRARIMAASDAERQRIERNLHDGAQQRLVTLSLELRLLREKLEGEPDLAQMVDETLDGLGVALTELRELAQGLHPSVLTDHGLASALEFLAERAPLPVTISAPRERLPAAVEATAYYIAAEALTNVAKYARANRATILVVRKNGRLRIEVVDDGAGGADPRKGTGLRGLADRVAAIDGHLHVESRPGAGTRVSADLPCA
jgi:signal transduction histidine kinase